MTVRNSRINGLLPKPPVPKSLFHKRPVSRPFVAKAPHWRHNREHKEEDKRPSRGSVRRQVSPGTFNPASGIRKNIFHTNPPHINNDHPYTYQFFQGWDWGQIFILDKYISQRRAKVGMTVRKSRIKI
ncbi:MAG: hypothetical protein PHC90_12455 [Syntrophorhabdaceae bacterium]|nr:hypothetical protein [Syntrophorhabdaceae bacterium]